MMLHEFTAQFLDISLPAQVFVGSNLKKLKEQLKGK
jgi:hypothetical protein